jgi:hypothetical protein
MNSDFVTWCFADAETANEFAVAFRALGARRVSYRTQERTLKPNHCINERDKTLASLAFARKFKMTPDRSNPNRNGINGMSTGTMAAIAIAIALIVVGAFYWNGNRNNTTSNVGTPAQTTGSGAAPNNATTGSGSPSR